MRIGVNDRVGIARDRDVAFPENQVAALQLAPLLGIDIPAETVLLHVAVARAAGARGVQCDLHKTRTIDSKTALAAPQIRRPDEAFGDLDKILLEEIEVAEMASRHIPAFAGDGERAVLACHGQR